MSDLINRSALCALALGVCAVSSTAYAHTGVKDEATEGKSLYTAFTITHGCAFGPEGATSTPKRVRAQGAVFPNGAEGVATKIIPDPDGTGPLTATEEPITLSEHIDGATGGLPLLSPGLVQDRNVFNKLVEVTDPANSSLVRAIHLTKGNLETTLVGFAPFRVTAPKFKATSCAKRLLVRIAVANWCTKSASSEVDDRVDAWVGRATPLFNDEGVLSLGFWPTLTVNRTSALPAECGGGYDIAVSPSDADIDTYLPIDEYWPANAN